MPHVDLVESILASITRPEDGPDAADRLEPFTEATTWSPSNRGGKKPHVAKVHRDRAPGTRVPGGRRIRLRAVRTSAGWCTTRRWYAEHLAAVTAAYEGESAEPAPQLRTTAARRRAIAKAEHEAALLNL